MQTINAGASFKVEELYNNWGKELQIELVAGQNGLDLEIRSNKVQKPGLRMIDPNIELEEGKIQILGRTEVSYFNKLSKQDQVMLAEKLCSQDVPCFLLSKSLPSPEVFKEVCKSKDMPLFATNLYTGRLISTLNAMLEERLAPFVNIHGVLVDIHRIGVLILGKSSIGKSECALDLILRGSKLIADDVVCIRKIGTSKLIGSGHENIKHLMEIRGVGIINIKALFGTASVMDKREIDMVIELSQWDTEADYDRLGLDTKTYNIMEVPVPYLVIPVSPGRITATIVEVAVRNQLLKLSGVNTAERFAGELDED